MTRMKECFKYRGRCMERIYPENVTQCCSGYVGKHCDNYVQDEYYFASSVAGAALNFLEQPSQRIINARRGPKGDKGDKGNMGPEGFLGMPGRKGEPGMAAAKGQKGNPGISVKGERGKKGRKGKAGRRGQKGDTGPRGPPGLPGLPVSRGSRKTGECNCSDLVSRVEDLENLVRGIIDGKVVIPRIGQAISTGEHPPRGPQGIPKDDRSVPQVSHKTQMSDDREFRSTTIETTTLIGEESEALISSSPPTGHTEYEPSTLSDLSVTRQTTAILTTEMSVKCNTSTTISDCPSGSFCKIPEPLFIQNPPPFPSSTNFSRTYFNRLSCCSTETLDFAFLYYKDQHMFL
ncbi:collagen alpha-1(I) chain-like isoform X2 [Pecten maximus]|nr:collagen alpha-1(I) chain-like isoform X2 [Pecten maximus]